MDNVTMKMDGHAESFEDDLNLMLNHLIESNGKFLCMFAVEKKTGNNSDSGYMIKDNVTGDLTELYDCFIAFLLFLEKVTKNHNCKCDNCTKVIEKINDAIKALSGK